MPRSIYRYNADDIKFHDQMTEVFRNSSLCPRIAEYPEVPNEPFVANPERNTVSGENIPEHLLLENEDYTSPNISITERWNMEQTLNTQLMKRRNADENETFSHYIWIDDSEDEDNNGKAEFEEGPTVSKSKTQTEKNKQHKNGGDNSKHCKKVAKPKLQNAHTALRGGTHDKTYPCDICGNTFNSPRLLYFHMHLHTGEKPFVCPVAACSRRFAYSSSLSAHQRKSGHHDWQFQCVQCKKLFSQQRYLSRHSPDACRKYLASLRSE